ncbi:Holliday junction branch migration protein RuvA [Taylorella equigenitalis]|uniref:Holliday junction branch migration complex subunit RuvA n=3 Tax=Taylorella equigenitalis TaxID=29575 RepID=A0A654KFM1_TAYEM|nr:Holliday junction branch migration protein RuvA [Taylorella equigenitalis]ADU91227.1 Holliday junction DNA helicase RuvA [Taylorella equigenitalis MCE9]AFN36330.1 Holliday junction ATP-dependent DNA helicase RuvA [Taylorella equigenitalis ATCC 35865]ASY30899.1 Holliday junction branch migration protein RuvA [Taylorella equigenitalis]ASY38204.1 Holliday junction branch migration protein RuvA [Taylorella equigenitalis]ASY39731.1 Holliday junction branch migration protein RuvA [Taylorella equi
MISRLKGKLIYKFPPTVCIDIGGIAYDVDVSLTSFYELPEVGQEVTLFTHLAVREDAHTLYGFISEDERATFRTLIKVNGIGFKSALGILSGMSPDALYNAIEEQDSSQLERVPGIGKKTAARIILELKGKLPEISTLNNTTSNLKNHNDVLIALLNLGYSEKQAKLAISTLPKDIDASEGVRIALRSMDK